ncbi:MAG: hypothetical protein J0H26_03205 [Alphaproteobacteria bacterium]|nr:hypothetical protein [Alphaproteobacteria bacterium]
MTAGKRKRGAQPGNRNAIKSGLHTAEMRALRKRARRNVLAIRAAIAHANLALRAQFSQSRKNENSGLSNSRKSGNRFSVRNCDDSRT